jgi:hypothetical protein
VTFVAVSAFQWVQALAGVVAALAALGTLVFAWLTVRGAQALQRQERRAHLLDLAADVGEAGIGALANSDIASYNRMRIARHRFRAAINATGEQLPASNALLKIEWWPPPAMGDYEHREAAANQALTATLDELAAWLRD